MARFSLAAALLALLAASIWFAFGLWGTAETAAMPMDGYIAMAVGIFFSIVVGCGLMALVFYSSRHGYDEAASRERPERDGSAR
jgi:Zn-dependent protease with chaperone function